MKKAQYSDKNVVVDILTQSFDTNKSVNSVIKQDGNRVKRIQALMEYSFKMCYTFGEVFLSDDDNACALILFPDKKRTTSSSLFWDLKLVYKSIGLANLNNVLNREAFIKKARPKEPLYYIWFGGVRPDYQNKGIGTSLLSEVLQYSISYKRSAFLETSAEENVSLYQKFGFKIYNELDLGYKLYMMKRSSDAVTDISNSKRPNISIRIFED